MMQFVDVTDLTGVMMFISAAAIMVLYIFHLKAKYSKKLDCAEKFLRSIIDGVTEPVMVIDPDWRVKLMNRAAHEFYSGSSRTSGYLVCHELLHQGEVLCDKMRASCLLEQVRRTGRPARMVHEYKQPNGEWHSIEILASPLYGQDGTFQGIVESPRDITERKLAERWIKESEERYRDIIELTTDIIYLSDRDGHQVFMNDAGYRMLDIAPENVIGHLWSKWIHPDDREKTINRFREMLEQGIDVFDFENRYVSKSGRVINVLHNVRVLRNERGEIIGTQGIARDITARKQAEKILQHRIDMEKLIANISTHFINLSPLEIDEGIDRTLQIIGEFADVDRSYVFMFHSEGMKMDNTYEWCAEGITPQTQSLKGLSIDDFPWFAKKIKKHEIFHVPSVAALPPEARAEKENLQMQDIKSLIIVPMVYGKSLIGFLGFDSVKKEKKWVEEDIRLLTMVGDIFANALERKRVEEKLREGERFLESIFTSIQDGIGIIDKDMNIIRVNATVEKWYQHSVPLAGKKCYEAYHNRSERCEVCPAWRTLKTGRTAYEVIHKSGPGGEDVGWIEIYSFPMIDTTTGQMRGAIEYVRDITKRKEAEEEVKKYAAELEESNQMKELFTDIMHHDLLNPLSVASTYIQLLQEIETYPKKRAYIGAIEKSLRKAHELIENATVFSKLKSLKSIEFEVLDLREVIERVIESMSPLASRAGMRIEYDFTGSMPVKANKIIEEVFTNLISNAIKYAPDGKRIIVKGEDGDNLWRIKIIDFGEGIKDADKAKIFVRFSRMEKRGVKGSGLGLAISSKIIELHMGRIWVEDNPEGGAVFVVEVPKYLN